MRPTECPRCDRVFLTNSMMVLQVKHELALHGPAAAQRLADELLAGYHEEGHPA